MKGPNGMSAEMYARWARDAAIRALRNHAIDEPTVWRDKLCKCAGCEQAKAALGMPARAGDWTRFPEGTSAIPGRCRAMSLRPFFCMKAEAVRDLADHLWGVVVELKSCRFRRLKRITALTLLAQELVTASEEMERAFCQERVYDLGETISRSRDDIQELERRIERLRDERDPYLEKYPNLYIGKRKR